MTAADRRAQEKEVAAAAVAAARTLDGTVSGLSAALAWGWSLKYVPELPEVTVPHRRRVRHRDRVGVRLRRVDLPTCDVDGLVTTPVRTVLDCARSLPFDEALCVADSALRCGVGAEELSTAADAARGPGSANVRHVVSLADGRAENAFESCLRAIAFYVPGLCLTPQHSIRVPEFLGRPDLVDEELRIIVEADSFEWHGTRAALVDDAQRYNRFSVNGWLVLRFTWEDVLLNPAMVHQVLVEAVRERNRSKAA